MSDTSGHEEINRAPKIRTFDTGATRDQDTDKLDYEGFLSPLVLEEFAKYMHEHRKQSDGNLRDSDNWQKGIPIAQYMKSHWRHFMDLWKAHRGLPAPSKKESLCAIIFNAQGHLHELLKEEAAQVQSADLIRAMPKGGLVPQADLDLLEERLKKKCQQVETARLTPAGPTVYGEKSVDVENPTYE